MSKRRAYRSCDVKNVVLAKLLESAPTGPITVGLDVGKREIFAVVRWSDTSFERPWKILNPSELTLLVKLLTNLAKERPMIVAMESTGTYGDALRQALTDAELDIQRVSGKAASDYAEIFDGVPSKHDGKDAAIVAELAALGKSSPWPYRNKTEWDAEMARWADWLDAHQSIQAIWTGRLEALLARHWPEVTRLLDLSTVTLLKMLIHYGGPAALAQDSQAASQLAGWGRSGLAATKIEKILQSASATVGAVQNAQDMKRAEQYATSALSAYREVQAARRRLEELSQNNEVIRRQAAAVGRATACVLWVALGDPRDYHCAAAYRKAMGLNLKERSSGRHKGRLTITKRGPSSVRRWLYFAAMRAAQKPEVRRWYEAKKAKENDRGKKALIGIMRRLAVALYVVAVADEPFESWRLFPGQSQPSRSLRSQQNDTPVAAMKA